MLTSALVITGIQSRKTWAGLEKHMGVFDLHKGAGLHTGVNGGKPANVA